MEAEGGEGMILIKSLESSGVRIRMASVEELLSPPTLFSICSQSLRLLLTQNQNQSPPHPHPHGDRDKDKEDDDDYYYYYMMYTSSSMPDRFTICSHLASALSSLGFTPNITFHTFLYPTEDDSKKLLRFFVQKLSQQQPNIQLPAHKTSSNNHPLHPANGLHVEEEEDGFTTISQHPKSIPDLPEPSNSRTQDSSNEDSTVSHGLEKLKTLKQVEQQIQAVLCETRIREEELCKLSADLRNQPKAASSRRSYIQRITEIAKNSRKQDADIERILKDTRELQLESNYIQERLNRTYAVVDETVFREGKKDPVGRQAYRLLTSIHESFEQISDKILGTDRLQREAAEYEAKLSALSRRSFNVEKLQADLDAIKRENELLERGDDNVDYRIL